MHIDVKNNNMKILYVTNLFGLIGSSAAVRNSSLIKGLVANGHIVDVLTIKYPREKLSKKLCDCGCRKVYEVDYGMSKVYSSNSISRRVNNSAFRKLKRIIRQLIFFPDIYTGWIKRIDPCTFCNLNFDLLISSSDNKSSHYVAEKINKLCFQKKWIQVWGDPWSIDSTQNFLNHIRAQKKEYALFKEADKVVFVSEITLRAMQSLYPQYKFKMHYIPRGYYDKVVVKKNIKNSKNLKILYTGKLNEERNYAEFLEDIKKYNACNELQISVLFYGTYFSDTFNNLSKYDFVAINNTVDYESVLELYKHCDALLFISNGVRSTQIPGKLFDYMGTNLPVICLLSGNNELNSFVGKMQDKCLVFDNNIEQIVDKILTTDFEVKEEYNPLNIAKKILD